MKFANIRIWLFLFGLIFLIAAYLFQQSNTNQEQLERQAMKSIELTRVNFLGAFKDYHYQLDSYLRRLFYSLSSDDQLSPAHQMVKRFDVEKRFPIQEIRYISNRDSIAKAKSDRNLQLVNFDSTFILESNYLFELEQKDKEGNFQTDSKQFNYLLKNLEVDRSWKFSSGNEDPAGSRTFGITHLISIYQLMKNTINNRFFDGIYVVDGEGKVIYPHNNFGMLLFDPASLFSAAHFDGSQSEAEKTVGNKNINLQINSIEHEVFIAPVWIGSEYLYLTGVKETQQFQKVAMRINFNLLSAFIIALSLIFTSIPIFSMVKMERGDVLSSKKVYGLGLSLIMITLIIGFSSSFLRREFREYEFETDFHLIQDSYQENIEFFKELLTNYRKTDWNELTELKKPETGSCTDSIGSVLQLFAEVNEYLEMDSDSRISIMDIPNIPPSGICLDFEDNKFVTIRNRDYAQFLNRESDKFFISAHYSQTTSLLEGVISRKGEDQFRKAITFQLSKIAKEESRSHSFLLFKSSGKILYKSDLITIPVSYLQQAVDEKKWKEIETLTTNNAYNESGTDWKIPLYVNGYEYLGILKKSSLNSFDEPIWLIFLVNNNLQHSRSSLVSIETIIFAALYILVLSLLSVLVSLVNKQSIYLNIRSFSNSWFSPSALKRSRFLLLNYILGSDIIIFIVLFYLVPLNIFTVFLWCTFFAIHASFCKFVLIHPKSPGPFSSEEYGFMILIGVLWIINLVVLNYWAFISANGIGTFGINLFVSLLLTGSIVYSFIFMYYGKSFPLDPLVFEGNKNSVRARIHQRLTETWQFVTQTPAPKRIFSLCILLWVILIGFLPGYLLHRKINAHENYIWEMAQDRIPVPVKIHSSTNTETSNPVFSHILKKYETIRRVTFSEIIDQHDDFIRNFLAPKEEVLQSSFSMPIESQLFIRDKNKSQSILGSFFQTLNYILQKLVSNWFFWMICLLFFIAMFKLIMYLCHRIFLTEYLFTYDENKIPKSCSESSFNFIVSTDTQKARSWILFNFDLLNKPVSFLDAMANTEGDKSSSTQTSEYSALVLENIHTIEKPGIMMQLLHQILEECKTSNIPLFVTSGKSYRELEVQFQSENDKLVFSEVLHPFIFHTVSLHFQNPSYSLPYLENNNVTISTGKKVNASKLENSPLFKDEYIDFLNHEINYGHNPRQISALITHEILKDPIHQPMGRERYEKCILTIQRYNKAFYINLWNELSFNEKKMVYYFAVEGFINYTNRETLTALIQKGVFILNKEKNGLVLFTVSFRNFISQLMDEKDLRAFKKDEQNYGNSGNIQTAAISFVFISIAVISYYDPNILNKTSAYVSAIIGLLGTIYSFFSKGLGLFNGIPKKET